MEEAILLETFYDEGLELVDLLETGLIELEETKRPTVFKKEYLRNLHTLKGSSGQIPHQLCKSMSEIIHKYETYLSGLSNDEHYILKISIEIGFLFIDAMRDILDSLIRGRAVTHNWENLLEKKWMDPLSNSLSIKEQSIPRDSGNRVSTEPLNNIAAKLDELEQVFFKPVYNEDDAIKKFNTIRSDASEFICRLISTIPCIDEKIQKDINNIFIKIGEAKTFLTLGEIDLSKKHLAILKLGLTKVSLNIEKHRKN